MAMSNNSLKVGDNSLFCMMDMVEVNGPKEHQVFQFLKYNSSLYDEKKDVCKPIGWNFSKFLVNPNGGGVYKYYDKGAKFDTIKADIDLLLSADAPQTLARKPNAGPSTV
eukprot:gb/GFBE01045069.1/.p1 GENE.gb/GFBE01045069.1/~~gb/GFBE01045069.1/.p1  ORF type:complete len:110 (+),score=39.13 gb/GFBE01045069.1/:1-330(+)